MGAFSVEAFGEIYSRKYAPHWDAGKGPNPPIGRHYAAARLIAELRGVASVLDVGCGPGQLLYLLQAAGGKELAGTEVVDVLCKRQLAPFTIYLAGLPDLAGVPAHDAVCALDVLEHLEEGEVEASVVGLSKVCRRFLLTEISSDACFRGVRGARVNLHRTMQPQDWWRDRIAPRFVEVLGRGGVTLWVKRDAAAAGVSPYEPSAGVASNVRPAAPAPCPDCEGAAP